MRNALAARKGERLKFRAVVERYGEKSGWHGVPVFTILLRDVTFAASGKPACDHVWLTQGVWSSCLNVGDRFEFTARIDSYVKGYCGGRAERLGLAWSETDYHLERPTRVVVLDEVNKGGASRKQRSEAA